MVELSHVGQKRTHEQMLTESELEDALERKYNEHYNKHEDYDFDPNIAAFCPGCGQLQLHTQLANHALRYHNNLVLERPFRYEVMSLRPIEKPFCYDYVKWRFEGHVLSEHDIIPAIEGNKNGPQYSAHKSFKVRMDTLKSIHVQTTRLAAQKETRIQVQLYYKYAERQYTQFLKTISSETPFGQMELQISTLASTLVHCILNHKHVKELIYNQNEDNLMQTILRKNENEFVTFPDDVKLGFLLMYLCVGPFNLQSGSISNIVGQIACKSIESDDQNLCCLIDIFVGKDTQNLLNIGEDGLQWILQNQSALHQNHAVVEMLRLHQTSCENLKRQRKEEVKVPDTKPKLKRFTLALVAMISNNKQLMKEDIGFIVAEADCIEMSVGTALSILWELGYGTLPDVTTCLNLSRTLRQMNEPDVQSLMATRDLIKGKGEPWTHETILEQAKSSIKQASNPLNIDDDTIWIGAKRLCKINAIDLPDDLEYLFEAEYIDNCWGITSMTHLIPSYSQFAVATLTGLILGVLEEPYHLDRKQVLWTIGTGLGKSRVMVAICAKLLFFDQTAQVHFYFANEKLMQRDRANLQDFSNQHKDSILFHFGELGLHGADKEPGANARKQFMVVDECDVMILDHPQTFNERYPLVKQRMEGIVFLTATSFEKSTINKSKTVEQVFVEMHEIKQLSYQPRTPHQPPKTVRLSFTEESKSLENLYLEWLQQQVKLTPVLVWVENLAGGAQLQDGTTSAPDKCRDKLEKAYALFGKTAVKKLPMAKDFDHGVLGCMHIKVETNFGLTFPFYVLCTETMRGYDFRNGKLGEINFLQLTPFYSLRHQRQAYGRIARWHTRGTVYCAIERSVQHNMDPNYQFMKTATHDTFTKNRQSFKSHQQQRKSPQKKEQNEQKEEVSLSVISILLSHQEGDLTASMKTVDSYKINFELERPNQTVRVHQMILQFLHALCKTEDEHQCIRSFFTK